MIVIADSSALIALATCAALDLLLHMYDDVYVPQAGVPAHDIVLGFRPAELRRHTEFAVA